MTVTGLCGKGEKVSGVAAGYQAPIAGVTNRNVCTCEFRMICKVSPMDKAELAGEESFLVEDHTLFHEQEAE